MATIGEKNSFLTNKSTDLDAMTYEAAVTEMVILTSIYRHARNSL